MKETCSIPSLFSLISRLSQSERTSSAASWKLAFDPLVETFELNNDRDLVKLGGDLAGGFQG
ncbi:hypothetical protein F4801DRAFT_555395 [Xylaria longipes]|nr:hypothetical protein F4801DRAFT_555395 [Xylaria longipes]